MSKPDITQGMQAEECQRAVLVYIRNAWTPVDAYEAEYPRLSTGAVLRHSFASMVEPVVLPSSTTSTLSILL